MTAIHCDCLVLGAEQAGTPLCRALAQSGKRTAIIEREHVGGTCINEGCTPTKTMVASARVAYLTRRGADYGVHTTGPVQVDMVRVRERKRKIVDDFRSGSQHRIEETPGVELLFGEARFTAPHTLAVQLRDGGARTLAQPLLVLNTGDRPAVPQLPGLERVPSLDSTSIMDLDHVPAHLLVLGGGYIALEFGQMFRRFGSRVTLVQRSSHLLSREDADVADEDATILR